MSSLPTAHFGLLAGLLLLASAPVVAGGLPESDAYTRSTRKTFENVLWDLRFAITQRNFRIVGHNRLGEAIRKRGHKGFPRAQVLELCNLTYARRLLEKDWRFLRSCPYRIVLYKEGKRVLVSARLLPVAKSDAGKAALAREVNALLREMVDFAAE